MKASFIKILVFTIISYGAAAQGNSKKEETPKNWHQLDKSETGYYGISLDKAYNFVKGKKSKTVIVAVLDGGVDTIQEDLKPILWHNPKEIPGNGIDDDNNGYIDDVYGWNFLGGKDGRNVDKDSDEGVRVYYQLKAKYGDAVPDSSAVKPEDRAEVAMYRRAKEKVTGSNDIYDVAILARMQDGVKSGDSALQKEMGKATYTGNDLKDFTPQSPIAKLGQKILLPLFEVNKQMESTNTDFVSAILDEIGGDIRKAQAKTTPPEEYRKEIVKDDETDINDKFYGNNDVMAGNPIHGTHCSGIIGAVRNNGKGVDGIADNVKIMMLRVVPDGDEHDKDIANAIRYATDNGAQIISMSFGKSFSPEKRWIDDAVKYAASKNVLMVHAAGNDGEDVDSVQNFPNPVFADSSGRAENFITVGASGDPSNGGLVASFSNYGKKEVDVFAPGVKIYSTYSGTNNYANLSGTSMACPVVAGEAAFLLSYYPTLNAKQLKYVIEKSAVPFNEKVTIPGGTDQVTLADISKSGGEINVYEAAKLAASLTGEKVKEPEVLPKPKMNKKAKG